MRQKNLTIRRNWRGLYAILFAFVMVFLFSFLVQRFKNSEQVDAASLAGFDPGYIISDWQMGNYNSMSEGEIQAFLTAKNNCGNRDYGYYVALSSNPNYRWHFENGHFICLSEERFGYNDNEIGFQYGETAAHIIWQAAQDYRINPQVLLVLLQKETGLITDPIPNNGDYRKATGYGCPDTAACSSQYYGFRNQIRNAAALFRTVLNGGWTNYPLGNNYIQYNPNGACGGSVVNVRSLATSALYRYTPYQPNAGALAAGYGTASCGAYGNRNFYLYFEDWFGGITAEGWPSMHELMTTNRATTISSDVEIKYRSHITHYGWLDWVSGGVMSGTAGYGYRMEGISLKLDDMANGDIEYRAHVADRGWLDYVKNGELAGTTGQGLRMEAVQIRLTGKIAEKYDVYYRVHVADIGWMEWVKNDELAGTVGESKQMEAIQIRLLRKEGYDIYGDIEYKPHVQNIGWMDWVKNGELAGTTGQSLRMEAIEVKLDNKNVDGEILYRTHVQNIGWMDWVKNGELAGTTGQSLRMEAIEVKLDGEIADLFDVYYRVHSQNIGWTEWRKNGETAGTMGQALRMEAVEAKLERKDD